MTEKDRVPWLGCGNLTVSQVVGNEDQSWKGRGTLRAQEEVHHSSHRSHWHSPAESFFFVILIEESIWPLFLEVTGRGVEFYSQKDVV